MQPSPVKPPTRWHARRRIVNEPLWRPMGHFTCATLAPHQRAWLTDNGSLTARLMGSSGGDFSVQRLYQGWEVPLPSERTLLELPSRQLALAREVTLKIGGEAVVFARSIFPIASLTGSLAHLRRLQNKSLGAILFRHPDMLRYPFELAQMAGDCDYLPENLKQAELTWGRRSRFEIAGKRLMVSEVFLDAFKPWPAPAPTLRRQRGKVSAVFRSPSQ